MELSGTLQLLVYADDVNMLGGSIRTIKKNTETLVDGLELNAKYIVMNRVQNAGRNHRIKLDNISFEGVEDFKYLGTNLTDQNCIQEETKIRLLSENTCHHSVQKLASPGFLSKYVKINIILPVVLYGCETVAHIQGGT